MFMPMFKEKRAAEFLLYNFELSRWNIKLGSHLPEYIHQQKTFRMQSLDLHPMHEQYMQGKHLFLQYHPTEIVET